MPVASCTACEARVPGGASFCPGCGGRVGDDVALRVRPRVTPANVILALALLAVGLAVVVFSTGHPIAGLLLLVAALIQFGLSGEAARQRPDTRSGSTAAPMANRLRAEARLVVERARRHAERRRLGRTLDGLRGRRAELLQALGDGVYRGDAEDADEALLALRTLDGEIAGTSSRLRTIAGDGGPQPVAAPEPSLVED